MAVWGAGLAGGINALGTPGPFVKVGEMKEVVTFSSAWAKVPATARPRTVGLVDLHAGVRSDGKPRMDQTLLDRYRRPPMFISPRPATSLGLSPEGSPPANSLFNARDPRAHLNLPFGDRHAKMVNFNAMDRSFTLKDGTRFWQ